MYSVSSIREFTSIFLIVFTLLKMLYIFGQDNLDCFREDAAHVQMLSPQHVKTAIDHLGYSGNLR